MADVAAAQGAVKKADPPKSTAETADPPKVLKGDAARSAVEPRTAPATSAGSKSGATQAREAAAARAAAARAAEAAAAKRSADAAAAKAAADAATRKAAESTSQQAAVRMAVQGAPTQVAPTMTPALGTMTMGAMNHGATGAGDAAGAAQHAAGAAGHAAGAAGHAAGAAPHAAGAAGHGAAGAVGHAASPQLPATSNDNGGDPRFLAGTVGPVVKEGVATTVKIPDGKGFDGGTGQKQNANDKAQNNYSVTDANFNPGLGLLPANPDTGQPLNYNEHTATYNAAGYVKSTAEYYAAQGNPSYLNEYNKIVANQDAGSGTVLGATSNIMRLFDTPDPALAGVDVALLQSMGEQIPGSDRSAFEYVRSSSDVTGQAWARMHHPESAWDMYYSLTGLGVDSETAFTFAGDDGVSGSGRLNGYNNQDGQNSFNAGEVEIWKQAAEYEQRTGIPVVQAMMSGHDHTGLDAGAKTTPNANKLLGIDPGDVSASPARAAAVRDGLLNGLLSEANNDGVKKAAGGGGGGAGAAGGAGRGGAAGAGAGAAGAGGAGGAR